MDYSFLDKPEYSDIPIYNVTKDQRENPQVHITKYVPRIDKKTHRHRGLQINYIYEGKATHIINGFEFEYKRGDISVILPFIPHILLPSREKTQIIELEFLPEFISQNFSDIDNNFFDFAYLEPFISYANKVNQVFSLSGSAQIEVEDLLEEALREFSAGQKGYSLMVKALVLKLLVILGREFRKHVESSTDNHSVYVKHKETVNYAIQYIEENYNADISIEDVAKEVSFSPSYFSYLFRLATSSNFTEYLINLRIRRAMELLKDSGKQVSEIASEVGFNNVTYFNRVFKEKTGLSPTQYRKQK